LSVHRPGRCGAAVIDDALSLERAIDGVPFVINCAGPFGETAPALLDAAIRTGAQYIDITGNSPRGLDGRRSLAS
jgi:short subunit dehydrogenase-like uncharacterized protein